MIQRMFGCRAAAGAAVGVASAASSRRGQPALAKVNTAKKTEAQHVVESDEIVFRRRGALRLKDGMAGMLSRQGGASSLRQTTAALTVHFHQAGGFAFGR